MKHFGSTSGLTALVEDQATPASGMVNYITSSFQSGYQNGDIKGAFLSDTDDTDLVYSDVAATLGAPWTGASASYDSGTGYVTYSAQFQSYGIRITNTADVNGLSNVGKQFYAEIDVKWISGNNTINFNNYTTTSASSTIPTDGTTVTLTVQATVINLGAYNGLFAMLQFRGSSDFPVLEIVDARLTTKDQDRSVNNNGLIVNGTVTRSPVATGADLVAYSGFSASNYLEQPYNSDLDFGTGDFCIMGWVKVASNGKHLMWRGVGGSAAGANSVNVGISSGGYPFVRVTDASEVPDLLIGSSPIPLNVWGHVVGLRRSGYLEVFLNGSWIGSFASTKDVSNGLASLLVGVTNYAGSISSAIDNIAFLRISATAPTAEQIAKIYNDEKMLFQENAQATLYGASDAVTALAHDPDTDLLHVGTSAGRSVFEGLRRVGNTTTSVSTAISASGGLIVEK